jgi:hypothetical protein
MTYGQFLDYVDSFLNKPEMTARIPSFVSTAKLRLQRKYDFNFTRVEGEETYPGVANTGITLPTNFKGFTGQHSVRLMVGTSELPLVGSTLETERRRGTSSGVVVTSDVRYYVKRTAATTILLIEPEPLSQTIKFEYFSWLDDYVDSSEEDFFLLRGHDVLLWETLAVANMYLAEENRVQINASLAAAALEDLWSLDNQMSLTFIDVS